LTLAEQRIDTEEPEDRLRVLGRLAAAWSGRDPERAARAAAALARAMEPTVEGGEDPWGWSAAKVEAIEQVQDADPDLARRLLRAASDVPAESSTDYGLKAAARLWASWGDVAEVRHVVESLLGYYRGLGWYGPARDIAGLAVIVDAVDPGWAQELAGEAMALVEPVVHSADEYERLRLNGTLGGIVSAFLSWDRDRALVAARWMTGRWTSGGPWNSTDGRLAALAAIGLDVADRDTGLATELLEECLHAADVEVVFGRPDARYVQGGLFRPLAEHSGEPPGRSRTMNFVTYLMNQVNYWVDGRHWRFFSTPAEVARSVEISPDIRGSLSSWAGAVAAAVAPVAAHDADLAVDLAGWIVAPGEHLIACASLVAGLTAIGDDRARAALIALDRATAELPPYGPEVDLEKVAQGPVLTYLNPSAHACFEAALALPASAMPRADALAAATGSWYLQATCQAELTWDWLLYNRPGDLAIDSVLDAVGSARRHPDDLQGDLVRAAAAWQLGALDPRQAEAVTAEIGDPATAALGRLLALGSGGPGGPGGSGGPGEEPSAGYRAVLDGLDGSVKPLHRAALATVASQLLHPVDAAAAADLAEWGVSAVQDADPLAATVGFACVAGAVEARRAAELLRSSMSRSAQIGNPYLRDGALALLLVPAVATGDPRLVSDVTRRVLESGWKVLVAALQLAMPELVQAAGPAVVAGIDTAMRDAQRVLDLRPSGDAREHLDGVAGPGHRRRRDWIATLGENGYAALFLNEEDLAPLRRVQDSRIHPPDPDDAAFVRYGGLRGGFAVWMGSVASAVWRLVDIRFVFPDEERAAAYHAERLIANSEGNPEVHGAPPVGEECSVFGGRSALSLGGAQVEMVTYFYVFRIANVVVKLFVAQGPEAVDALTPDRVAVIAARIADRLHARPTYPPATG
jgi:hypothetical protein